MKSHYSLTTRKVYIALGENAYGRFHELAHKEQHEQMAAVFLLWAVCSGLAYWVPFAERVSLYLVERDAMLRTRKVMTELSIWNASTEADALRCLESYWPFRARSPRCR